MFATLILAVALSPHAPALHAGPSVRTFGPDKNNEQVMYCHVEATRASDMAPIHLTFLSRTGTCTVLPPGYRALLKAQRPDVNRNPAPAAPGSTPK